MKTIVSYLSALALFALAPLAGATGKPPEMLSYQGFLVDANGVPLGTSESGAPQPANYDVIFRVYNASSGGSLLWAEEQTITVDNGYFSVVLGEGAVSGSDPRPDLSTVFTGIGADERFIGVSVRFTAGGEFSDILPRLRLLTSPYSFLASQARAVVNPDGQSLLTAEGGQVTIAGSLAATHVAGNGASLTNLNASQVSSGTIADARLPGNLARLGNAQTFTQKNIFQGGLVMDKTTIQLGLAHDTNHGLEWDSFYDGPLLYGYAGGALGTSNGKRPLRWTNSGQVMIDDTGSSLGFGARLGQHLNLYGGEYAMGIQAHTMYFRSGEHFGWYKGGGYDETQLTPGTGGTLLMKLDGTGHLTTTGISATGATGVSATRVAATDVAATDVAATRVTASESVVGGEIRTGRSDLYGYFWQDGNTAGTGRYLQIGGGGNPWLNNGSNRASYDGDNNWDFFSDARLKEDIEDAEPILNRLLDIRLRRFRYKGQEMEKMHLGVIAQELQPLFPDFVSTGPVREDGNAYKMVAYTDFGLIAIGGVQELEARHAAELEALRTENADLRSRLQELEANVELLLENR